MQTSQSPTHAQPVVVSCMCPKHAFTLIELLVVISIVALLISILLPALKSARSASRTVKCLSNLRQVGVLVQLYTNDNKTFLPPPYAMPGTPYGTQTWLDHLLYNYMFQGSKDRLNRYYKETSDGGIARCPERETSNDAYKSMANNNSRWYMYGVNYSSTSTLSGGWYQPKRQLDIEAQLGNQRLLYVTDSRTSSANYMFVNFHPSHYASNYTVLWPAERHKGGANVLWFDSSCSTKNTAKDLINSENPLSAYLSYWRY